MFKERNHSYDVMKGIACIMVVLSHFCLGVIKVPFKQFFCRWMVPFFFVIAGFFFRRNDVSYCLKKAKHIGMIAVWASLLYIIFCTVLHLIIGDLSYFVHSSLYWKQLVFMLVLNDPTYISVHLWYLFAMLYVYLIYAFMIRWKLTRFNKPFCVLLFLVYFAATYGLFFVTGIKLPNICIRNFALQGMPFFLLGIWVYEGVKDADEKRKQRLSRIGAWLFIVSAALKIAEYFLIGSLFSYSVFCIPMVIGMVYYAQVDRLGNRFPRLEKLGNEHSLVVYIVHYMFTEIYLQLREKFSVLTNGGGGETSFCLRLPPPSPC